jgi:LppX_LprAFG lipoprotein
MSRRLPAAFAVFASAAIALAACSGPAAPALTSPNDVIEASLKATEAAKSFHADITVDGKLSTDALGTGTAQTFDLAGTTASADVDIANKAVHASFALPAGLLGVSGDLIVVDQKAYVKTSVTGPLYMVSDVKDVAGADVTDPGKTIDNVGDLLTQPGIDPVKGDDVACGSKQCYTVNVDLTADELTKIAGAQASSLPVKTDGSLKVQIRVEKDTNHLAGATVEVASPSQGNLKLDIVLSKWDEAVSISAPPADQIKAS